MSIKQDRGKNCGIQNNSANHYVDNMSILCHAHILFLDFEFLDSGEYSDIFVFDFETNDECRYLTYSIWNLAVHPMYLWINKNITTQKKEGNFKKLKKWNENKRTKAEREKNKIQENGASFLSRLSNSVVHGMLELTRRFRRLFVFVCFQHCCPEDYRECFQKWWHALQGLQLSPCSHITLLDRPHHETAITNSKHLEPKAIYSRTSNFYTNL